MLGSNMRFGWDEAKRRRNLKDHGVDFTMVHQFSWDFAQRTIDDREDYGELREKAIGLIGDVPYVVIFTERKDARGD
jgi:uncharacterized DUF497 family protein